LRACAARATMHSMIAALEHDHRDMEALWAALRGRLVAWSGPEAAGPVPADWHLKVEQLRARYATHLALAESVAFPATRSRTDVLAERVMGEEIRSRHRAA
jgi:hypothetical protein